MAASPTSFTYTASKDCYAIVYEQSGSSAGPQGVTINNINVIPVEGGGYTDLIFSGYLKQGDIIKVDYLSSQKVYINTYELKT